MVIPFRGKYELWKKVLWLCQCWFVCVCVSVAFWWLLAALAWFGSNQDMKIGMIRLWNVRIVTVTIINIYHRRSFVSDIVHLEIVHWDMVRPRVGMQVDMEYCHWHSQHTMASKLALQLDVSLCGISVLARAIWLEPFGCQCQFLAFLECMLVYEHSRPGIVLYEVWTPYGSHQTPYRRQSVSWRQVKISVKSKITKYHRLHHIEFWLSSFFYTEKFILVSVYGFTTK